MRFIIIYLILLFNHSVFSQNSLAYIGTLILNNNTNISFKLNLIEKKGIVNGVSITNIGTKDETKSKIEGLYFNADKSYQLQETQILSTNSDAPLNTFCYINMELSLKGKLGKKRLEGNFIGNYLDGSECAKGEIILLEENIINKKTQKIKKKLAKKNSKNYTNLIQQTKILKDGDNFSITWESKKLTLFIWDANKEDGDKIQLKINNEIILDKFETKNKRKKIKYKLNKGENIVIITAQNTGILPPNTSKLELIDKKIKYPILYQLEDGKSVVIKIIKE